MSRLTLLHWNEEEAGQRLEALKAAGYEAKFVKPVSAASMKDIGVPDAFVIDLSRMPSNGRAVGVLLRQRKQTRDVPLIFLGGLPEKVAKAREVLPDATYGDWAHVKSVLKEALRQRPERPLVPGTMAGYSGTPLAKKLMIREGLVVALLEAPEDVIPKLGPLPANVGVRREPGVPADVVVLFVEFRQELASHFHSAVATLAPKGKLWIAWPKRASGRESDLTETFVREYGLAQGFVDYKICAIDETWSGLCFAERQAGTMPL